MAERGESVRAERVPHDLIEAIYDAMHPAGWRWANLTSGEANQEMRAIVPVLIAVPDGWARVNGEWVHSDGPSDG